MNILNDTYLTSENSLNRLPAKSSPLTRLAQSAGVVEYTDCTSTEVYPTNECPRYDTKQFDGAVPVM